MFDQKKLDRINELAKKNKEEGLTEAETKERAQLREEYLANFRAHFRSRLDNVKVVHTQEEYDEHMRKNNQQSKVYTIIKCLSINYYIFNRYIT